MASGGGNDAGEKRVADRHLKRKGTYGVVFKAIDTKAKRMDVVAGETAGVEGQLLLLYHVLFILQVLKHMLEYCFFRRLFTGPPLNGR